MTTVTGQYVINFKTLPNQNPWVDSNFTHLTTSPQILSGSYRRVTGSPISMCSGLNYTNTTVSSIIEITAAGASGDRARLTVLDAAGNGYLCEIDGINKAITIVRYVAFAVDTNLQVGSIATFTAGDVFKFTVTSSPSETYAVFQNGNQITLATEKDVVHRNVFTSQHKAGFGINYQNNGNVYIGSFGVEGITIVDTITWGVSAGTLPAGLTLSTAGLLSGTPTTAGAYDFTASATNSGGTDTQRYTGTVNAAATPPVITTTSLPNAVLTQSYSYQLAASGSTPMTWELTGGALPNGMSVSSSGLIFGTPTSIGTYLPRFTATNSAGSNAKSLTLNVIEIPIIVTTTLPDGQVGVPYDTDIAVYGTAPFTFTLTGGALPSGITLSTGGKLSGTPTQSGTFSPVITATNDGGSDSQSYTLFIDVAPVVSSSDSKALNLELRLRI